MHTMKVIAASGYLVPFEERAHNYITEKEAVRVPDNLYYRRLIADGDLIIVPEMTTNSRTNSRKKGKK